jgi:MFS family permease
MATVGAALPYPILAPIFVDAPASNFNHFMGLPPKLLLGLALAINPFGILLGSMVMGRLSDRFGRRRVLMISLFLTFLGHVATAIALQQGWYVLFVLARFATGLTEGNVAVLRAIIADLHPVLDRNRSFATFNSWLYMGWLLGPMAGGFALPLGASVPFWLAAAIILLCSGLLWNALPPDTRAQAESLGALFKVMREEHALSLLKDPALKQVFYLQLLVTLGVNAFYEFYPLWLVEFARFDSKKIALATACMCLVMSFSSSILTKLTGKERPLSQARMAALAIACGLVVQPWLAGWPGVALVIMLGVPISLYNAIAPAYFSEHFGSAGQGQIMGLLTTTFCLGNVIIALLGSVLTLLDTRLILVTGGLCWLAGAVLLGRWIAGRGPLGQLALEA